MRPQTALTPHLSIIEVTTLRLAILIIVDGFDLPNLFPGLVLRTQFVIIRAPLQCPCSLTASLELTRLAVLTIKTPPTTPINKAHQVKRRVKQVSPPYPHIKHTPPTLRKTALPVKEIKILNITHGKTKEYSSNMTVETKEVGSHKEECPTESV